MAETVREWDDDPEGPPHGRRERDDALDAIEAQLLHDMKRRGARNVAAQCASFNQKTPFTEVATINDELSFDWTDVSASPAFVVGQHALRLAPAQPYRLRWPIRRGRLQRTRARHSVQALRSDLATIWCHAMVDLLGVPAKQITVRAWPVREHDAAAPTD